MFNGYQITNALTTNPFQWKNMDDGPQSVKTGSKKIIWRVNALLAVAQATFAALQCCRLNLDDSANKTYKIYMVFSAVFYNFDVWLQLANLRNQTRLPRFVRGYVQFFSDVERKE